MTVSTSEVDRMLGSTELSTTDIQAFIDAAGRHYDNLTSDDSVATNVRDDVVARFAAHLIATGPERQISSASESDGSVSFEGDTGEGLSATTHGQIAMTLDPTGKLASSDKPRAIVDVPDTKGIDD